MAYADLDAVRTRYGRLAEAISETSQPSYSQIETLLEETSSEIDALLGSRGFAVPTDGAAALALRGLNADLATLRALPGSFPHGAGRAAAEELIGDIRRRVESEWSSLVSGKHVAVLLLESGGPGTAAGATSFWQTEGAREVRSEYPGGVKTTTDPGAERGMKF